MTDRLFALIDATFFVSCERLFRPDLRDRPIVVLSSNDGCVVSRSNEAKALAIPMGAPAFKYRPLFQAQDVIQFGSNLNYTATYRSGSYAFLQALLPGIEAYSVDEAFLDLTTLAIDNLQQWGTNVRSRILREVGVPISLGFAPTKTLAKLASERAKKTIGLAGVLSLAQEAEQRKPYLQMTPVEDVWGIGRRLAPRLKAEGVHTALDLSMLRPRYAQQLMGVHGRH